MVEVNIANNNKNKGYIDVTEEWLNKKSLDTKIIIDNYYFDSDGIKHPIKKKERMKLANKNSDEYKIAKILSHEIGGTIHLVPTFTDTSNSNIGVKTPDYRRNGLKWDLKTPKYKENYSNLFNDLFKKKQLKLQCDRFIINLINFPMITNEEISIICTRLFRNKYRRWIKGIIIIKNNKVYKIFIKK